MTLSRTSLVGVALLMLVACGSDDESNAGGSGGSGASSGSGGTAAGGTGGGSAGIGGAGGSAASGGIGGGAGVGGAGGSGAEAGSAGVGGSGGSGGEPAPIGPRPVAPSEVSAGTLFAAPDGSGTTCSASEPCDAWEVVEHATAGDVVFFRGGVYPIVQNLRFKGEGTANAPIVYASYPGELAIFDGSQHTSTFG